MAIVAEQADLILQYVAISRNDLHRAARTAPSCPELPRTSFFGGGLGPLTRGASETNNAHLLFLEDRIGSLDEGKQADFVVIDRDLLTCPEDQIRQARALATYLDGKRVFQRQN